MDRDQLRRALRRSREPQLHPGSHRRAGSHVRPVRARHLRRHAARGVGPALAVMVRSLPVAFVGIEGPCPAPPPCDAERAARLVDAPGYARRESDSYLSFPEWDIVYAYDDLAGVLAHGDESDFAYGRW